MSKESNDKPSPETAEKIDKSRFNGDISVPAQWRDTVKMEVNGKEEECFVTIHTISGSLARVMATR